MTGSRRSPGVSREFVVGRISGIMFTSLELQYIILTFKYFSKLPTCSFKFTNGELLADKRKIKVYFIYTKLVLWALNIAVAFTKVESTLASRNFSHIIMLDFEIINPIAASVFLLGICLYQNDMVTLMKQSLAFNRKLGKSIRCQFHRFQHGLHKLYLHLLV
jgi:hypothetical protein